MAGKAVRIRFDDGETGWGMEVEPGRVAIDNIPYTDRLNIDDLVEVTLGDGLPTIKRVLKRQFEHKTAITYPAPYPENFRKMGEAWHAAGMKCEGIFGGLALVAHKGGDPLKIAHEAGVTGAALNEAQPELEPIT
jgi:hypothetical protein